MSTKDAWIHLRYRGDIVEARAVLKHEQHSGLDGGVPSPYEPTPHYITRIEVYYGDNLITSVQCGVYVSKNPYFAFRFKKSGKGPLKIVWKDNLGKEYSKSAEV